jgi:hypothetical protein
MSGRDSLTYALLAVIGMALLAHAFFPRYEWRTIDQTGSVSVVVFDRWTGRFQRAVYDDKGGLNVMSVFTPF